VRYPARVIEIPVRPPARTYSVSIGHGALRALRERLRPFAGRPLLVVSSPRVWAAQGARLEAALHGRAAWSRVIVADGEARKSMPSLERLCAAFQQARLGRDGIVLAFGGGVIGDLAGFAAAVYMRGLDLVQVPTTLLAMVDSSVGGKVGVNHAGTKNLLGAFHQPRAVVADPELLATLPGRQLRSGAYEILKCAVLADPALFARLSGAPADVAAWSPELIEDAIAAAVRIKAAIVTRDERESGSRRLLNLGHTLGHALEAVTRYRRFTHGEAVGWGMIGAAEIARSRGLLPGAQADAIVAAVERLGRRPRLSDLGEREIREAVARDKKALRGRVMFVLPARIGRCVVRPDVSAAELRGALRALRAREARA
jgi:3-dehydroquinate synthase